MDKRFPKGFFVGLVLGVVCALALELILAVVGVSPGIRGAAAAITWGAVFGLAVALPKGRHKLPSS